MSKTVFKYFFDFLEGQEKWLNHMSQKGYRLKSCGKIAYTFEKCEPGQYEYAVEFVGNQSWAKAKEYSRYLNSMGFHTFTKGININFSYGKIRWRPYAKGAGQVSSSHGGFNQELFILEKQKDGNPFVLHTDICDQINTYKGIRHAYLWSLLFLAGLIAITFVVPVSLSAVAGGLRAIIALLGILYLIPTLKFSFAIKQLKEESKLFES